jgi:hypothetical protein
LGVLEREFFNTIPQERTIRPGRSPNVERQLDSWMRVSVLLVRVRLQGLDQSGLFVAFPESCRQLGIEVYVAVSEIHMTRDAQ